MSANVASPDIAASIQFELPVSYNNIAPSAGAVMFVSFNSASVSSVWICASTYALVAASCAFDGSATLVIAAEPAFRPLNVGVLPVPKPNEVLAVLPVSAVKFEPSPTMKAPSAGVKPATSES